MLETNELTKKLRTLLHPRAALIAYSGEQDNSYASDNNYFVEIRDIDDNGMVGDWSVGAGASGAIFGVVGGLIYVVAVNKGRLEDLSTRQLVIMAAFSLYLGFTSTGVDNTAHVAGLVIGIILAAILYRKPKRTCRADIWGV